MCGGVSGLQGSRMHGTGPSCLTFPCWEMGKLRHRGVPHPVDPGESVPIPRAPVAPKGCLEMWEREGGAEGWLFLTPYLLSLPASSPPCSSPMSSSSQPAPAVRAAQRHLPWGSIPLHHPNPPAQAEPSSPQDPSNAAPVEDEPSQSCAHAGGADRQGHARHPCSVAIQQCAALRTRRASLLCRDLSARATETTQSILLHRKVSTRAIGTTRLIPPRSRHTQTTQGVSILPRDGTEHPCSIAVSRRAEPAGIPTPP